LAFLCNCGSEETFEPTYEVIPDASVHVKSFFAEAAERGIDLDTANLIIEFRENLESDRNQPVCGTARGNLTNDQQNSIFIDPECLAWRFSDTSREILIYHELAHVFLDRLHKDGTFSNGDFRSIMFGGTWNVLRYYTQDLQKRPYYLDELFDPDTPTPTWAQ